MRNEYVMNVGGERERERAIISILDVGVKIQFSYVWRVGFLCMIYDAGSF